MNETVLFILLFAGVIVIAATTWIAIKSSRAKRAPRTAQMALAQAQADDQQNNQQLVRVGDERLIPASAPQPQAPALPPVATAPNSLVPAHFQSAENGVPDVMTLLHKAYEQLSTRQHRIESELARIEQLRGEREAVAVQAAALDQAMRAFAALPPGAHQIDPHIFESNGNRTAEKLSAAAKASRVGG